jgi:hypothetical protein
MFATFFKNKTVVVAYDTEYYTEVYLHCFLA